jgi:hypothetical protein
MENTNERRLPTNSERLFRILDALTGDSDASMWRINSVRTLMTIVRHVGLKDSEDPDAGDAAQQALYQIQEMLDLLCAALGGLSEYLPRLRSRADLDALKANWESDPSWDIETTSGFEAHAEDLLKYRLSSNAQERMHLSQAQETASSLSCV